MKKNLGETNVGCVNCFSNLNQCSFLEIKHLFGTICKFLHKSKKTCAITQMGIFVKKFFLNACPEDIDVFLAFSKYHGMGTDFVFSKISTLFSKKLIMLMFINLSPKGQKEILREAYGKDIRSLCPGLMSQWLR